MFVESAVRGCLNELKMVSGHSLGTNGSAALLPTEIELNEEVSFITCSAYKNVIHIIRFQFFKCNFLILYVI